MKQVKKTFIGLFIATMILFVQVKNIHAQQVSVSFQVFYDELSPYGTWVDYPEYGYVWMPSGMPDFVPYYSSGYWAYTDYGWMWVSNYAWGWAPFHYGRWMYDSFYGWIWVPDSYWGPAWVAWGYCDGYYGWAPLKPGMSITVTNVYEIPYQHWVFVPEKHMGEKNISEYYGPRRNNETLLKKTSVVKNTYEDKDRHTTYVSGPPRQDVEQSTGKKFQPVALKENDKPGQKINNESVEIYRPEIKPADENGKKPAPEKVVNLKDRNPMEKKEPVKKEEPTKKEEPKDMNKKEIPEMKKDNLPKDSPPEIKNQPEKNKTEPPLNKEPEVKPPHPSPEPQKPKQEPAQMKPPKKEPIQNPYGGRNINPKQEPYRPHMQNPKGMKKGNPH